MKVINQTHKTCPHCQTDNPSNAKFCRNCGRNLEATPSPDNSKSGCLWIIIILVIAAVIGFIIYASNNPNPVIDDPADHVEVKEIQKEITDSVVAEYDDNSDSYEEVIEEEADEEVIEEEADKDRKGELVYSEESGDLIYIDEAGNASPAYLDEDGDVYIFDEDGNIQYVEIS